MNQSKELHGVNNLVPARAGKKPGFHNQAALKAAARGQILEALTANKGGKVGKKGLIFRILESIDQDLDSLDPTVRRDARADALKMALSITKDDKAGGLEDILKAGGNVQINFSNYFEARAMPSESNSTRIAFPPPPDPGEAG